MYTISKNNECMLVEFNADFDYGTMKSILINKTLAAEFRHLHNLWMIGKHRAQLRLGDIQTLVDDFVRLHVGSTCTKKMAIVVEPGLTEAKMQLIASGIERLESISSRVFHTVSEARHWLLANNSPSA